MSVGLKDFVTKTIADVLEGVREIQKAEHLSRYIAPSSTDPQFPPDAGAVYIVGVGTMTLIKFDVAVTAENTDTSDGRGVKVAVVSSDASGEAATRNTAVSRVQFTMPVLLPSDGGSWAA